MIGKMKSMTTNNSINNIKEKYSKKRLNNISNRIRSLEKDITKLKNKETINNRKSIDNNLSIVFDKNNNTMISDESKSKSKSKYNISQKSFVKNYLFYNNDNKQGIKYNTNNNSYSNKNHKKDYSKSQIYKKINNYNNLIHEKKSILLNMKSQFQKRTHTKDSFKQLGKMSLRKNFYQNKNLYKNNYINEDNNLYNIKIQSGFQSSDKVHHHHHHVISMDKLNTNYDNSENMKKYKDDTYINKKDNDNNNNNMNINDMGKLEFEFELRHLKKKRNLLKKTNGEIITKLEEIKNKNIKMKNKILQEQKHNENIISNIILLNKNYSMNNNPNGLESFESISNKSNSEEFPFKNIILNVMDIKFEYENNILFKNFIEGINELLNISLLNNNNFKEIILNKVNELIKLKNNLNKSNDKYKYLIEENNKYLLYFNNLIKVLNIQNFDQLENFIQNTFVKNIKENERMKKIKKALITESTPDKKKIKKEKENIKRKISNQYINNLSQTILNNNTNNYNTNNNNTNNNNYYKLQKIYIDKSSNSNSNNKKLNQKINNYIYSKRKDLNNIYQPGVLNRTAKIDNLNINRFTLDDQNLQSDLQSLLYKNEKRNKYIPSKYGLNRNYKINKSENNKNNENYYTLKKNNCYNGNFNYFNRYRQDNFNNEDDIVFLNKNEETKINNNFDKLSLGIIKNNSAFNIIFNKQKNK